jgi:hypothetical protein
VHHQDDSVHLLVFLLSFKCDGNPVCKLELRLVTFKLFGPPEKMDVAESHDFGSALFGGLDFQVFTGSYCKEDSNGSKLGCCLFEVGAVLFGDVADD